MTHIDTTVIPCAGLGTRMLPLSAVTPKELLPLGDKPMLQWTVEEAVKSGVESVTLVTSPHKKFESIRGAQSNYLPKLNRGESPSKELAQQLSMLVWQYALQQQPLGLGHAILQAQEYVHDDWFLVQLPDEWYPDGNATAQLVTCFESAIKIDPSIRGVVSLTKVPLEKSKMYGMAAIREQADLLMCTRLVEKPSAEESPSDYAILGRYILHQEIFSILKETQKGAGGEIQLTDALQVLAERGQLAAAIIEGQRFDTGNIQDYHSAWRFILENLQS